MLDFNASSMRAALFVALMNMALQNAHASQTPRLYLGASRMGVECERALEFEYAQTPLDSGRHIEGRILRIFDRGHVMEDRMADWIRQCGFTLLTHDENGEQFGFSDLDGRLQGHIDGIFTDGPEGFFYPALWENKCVGTKSWREIQKHGVAVAKPVYGAQIALYQAYLCLYEHPAIFTAINADTMEIHVEFVAFDAALAQRMVDRAVRVTTAYDAGELLPRCSTTPTHIECKRCHWQDRCWGLPA